ncbi:hypothetical protein F0T03_02800 [Yersinia canariae]|uniref:Uncharacterized protein n=1 Tax=Yersinia canariae TaxID=2607663 RepID=A0A857EVU9_9GAMM|nr:hypothetical protein [Yersinia canariae]QHB31221.1 hypothetical protein F0T03_02800 [Yersinia canariae]
MKKKTLFTLLLAVVIAMVVLLLLLGAIEVSALVHYVAGQGYEHCSAGSEIQFDSCRFDSNSNGSICR